ncbi:uncharacterized protein CTHT_0016990 [Thermochaetoides thermophila DSM 1495]|uniref:Uncharacterized protein n=1 Tax=Chaetomium thermophilum (strain DSM 1495 / CBS 144.50 / IMI 039719) TaxID=759272 RepID=G0S2E9_CHATD|nr:hypothetical protein CTHT_0016990 [Thermochaetoides thermophila DSM 1495]EGS22182.1 hypothetical protein CTHT_0016990 [Thermochaetoides thermophila DSM 1495]
MVPSSAGVLAAFRRARDQKVRELKATMSVVEKLLSALKDVERNLTGNYERKVGKQIITKLHSFIQVSMTDGPQPSSPVVYHWNGLKPGAEQSTCETAQEASYRSIKTRS